MTTRKLLLFLGVALLIHIIVGMVAFSSLANQQAKGFKKNLHQLAEILKRHPHPDESGITGSQDFYLGVKQDDLGAYQAGLFSAIGARWYDSLHRQSLLGVRGLIRIKFHIDPAGIISEVTPVSGQQNGDLLTTAQKAVTDASGQFGSFPDSVRNQFAQGYNDEITFSVYKQVDLKIVNSTNPNPVGP